MKNECALSNEIYFWNIIQMVQYVYHLPFVAIAEGQNIDLFSLVKPLKDQIFDLFEFQFSYKLLNRIELTIWPTNCKSLKRKIK